MFELSDDQFQQMIDDALGEMPKIRLEHLKNVAILFADEPDDMQRENLRLRDDQSLFGLYEGVPLPFRQGQTMLLPDRITLFKNPILNASHDAYSLKDQIKKTLWHEMAHYYGLDHAKIHELEG